MSESGLTMEQIYSEYHHKVSCYVSGKIHNPHDSEDVISTVFLKINQSYAAFNSEKSSVSTWVYSITKNTVIDFYRSRKQLYELPEELESDGKIDENLLNDEVLEVLANALEQLDERLRDLIILHYFSGLTLKEIAEKMRMSYGNAKVLHSKALHCLKSNLAEGGIDSM